MSGSSGSRDLEDKLRKYAVLILLDRYNRLYDDIQNAVPDWWNIGEAEWADSYQSAYSEKEASIMKRTFMSRAEALYFLLLKVRSLDVGNSQRIAAELCLENRKRCVECSICENVLESGIRYPMRLE
ncbi:hypothetical protein EHQ53_13560 [Leptospira langatensis]|uniref:Uncharacterized protein n=1 Tax=Leptospira langatensis TaxID=2484983 RepID=A0ABY2MD96_9LEPT|nr:hypothetical protein EHQ53_13560 [Leptospira langatensis]